MLGGPVQIGGVQGSGQHDNDGGTGKAIGFECLQEFKPIHDRHIDIEENQLGQCCRGGLAGEQIVNAFLAIGGDDNFLGRP